MAENQLGSGLRFSMDGPSRPTQTMFGKMSESQTLPKGSLK